jgi:hypothetical protein
MPHFGQSDSGANDFNFGRTYGDCIQAFVETGARYLAPKLLAQVFSQKSGRGALSRKE